MNPASVDVVLVRPSRAANVAAACRAMKNMGVTRLKLVGSPPNLAEPAARALAYGAWDVLDAAVHHESLLEATGQSTLVVGTSGRPSSVAWSPRRLAQEGGARAGDGRVSLVFGPESSGLRNDELDLCHVLVHIPTDPAQPSLNLAQAVLLLAYEIRLSAPEEPLTFDVAAPSAEVEGALQELREGLVGIGYLNTQNPDAVLTELRRLLARARPSPREVILLRGLARQARWAARSIARLGRPADNERAGSALEALSMAEFRVPTNASSAEILTAEGQILVGRIFIPASASRHSGAMRAGEWLDEPSDFFPFLADGAETSVILNKRQVLVVSVTTAADGDEAEEDQAGTRRHVRVRCGEREFEGTVLIEMPESQSRLLDHLNRPSRFLGLSDGQRHSFIQMGQITSVQENRGGLNPLSLERLIQQASRAGGQEVRLIPGRRIVILTPAGEREVQGPAQSAENVAQLVDGVATDASRQALQSGKAEWRIEVAGVGGAMVNAEKKPGGLTVVVRLGGAAAPEAAAAPAPAISVAPAEPAPRRRPPSGPTGEMDELFTVLFDMKASDLHLSVGSPPMVRHDGEIKSLPGRPVLSAADTERMLFPIAPERNKEEFGRRNDTDFAYEVPGVARFRCNFFRDRKGVGGVFRVIPSKIMTAEEMNLSREILQLCSLPKGLVLVTGPTGSGKSTTLCALIDYINRNRTDHIITIEDPIEFVHENKKCLINQRQVGEHTDSFKDALRAALREDPDIVLVGEMRDLETVAIAIETAETGHLVFGTLHTSSAPSTVDRIIDQFPADRQGQIRVMLAESLKGVISQTLCKKIGGGRVPVLEILISTPSVSNLIREAKIFQLPSIMQTGKKYGMCLMNEGFTDLVKRKVVDPKEAYAKAMDKPGLINLFKKNAIDTSWAPAEAVPVSTAPA